MKTTLGRIGLAGLLVALALSIAACGGAGGPGAQQQEGKGPAGDGRGDSRGGGTQDEGHGAMGHGRMGGEEMARRMLEDESGNYSDRRFIDMMVPHHEGAVEMAEVALERSDREEILQLSRDIVRTQEAEIEELRDIKQEEFGTSEIPSGMNEGDMEMMGMMDAEELARQRPFDKAFIDAMIPHHESAIDMAKVVLEESENERLRGLAEEIVEAQEREIAQMERWREEWYPEG